MRLDAGRGGIPPAYGQGARKRGMGGGRTGGKRGEKKPQKEVDKPPTPCENRLLSERTKTPKRRRDGRVVLDASGVALRGGVGSQDPRAVP